jgi:hypothetical protein
MALTSEDYLLIQQIARQAVEDALQARKQTKRATSHTKKHEIRRFILDNLEALYKEFGTEQPFDIAVLRHWLFKRMILKPLDMNPMGDGAPRFNSQVSNAVQPTGWPGGCAPIQPTAKRGYYLLRDANEFI